MVSLVCAACGKPNKPTALAKSPRCQFCGEPLGAGMHAPTGRAAGAGAAPARNERADGVRCTSCSKINPPDRETCLRCDKPLPAVASSRGHISNHAAMMRLEDMRRAVRSMRTLFLSIAALEIVGPVVVVFLMRTSLPWEVMAMAGCFVPFLAVAAWKVIAAPVPWSLAVASVRTALTLALVLLGGIDGTFLTLNVVWTVLLWVPLPIALTATRLLAEHPELQDYWRTGVLHPELLHRVAR